MRRRPSPKRRELRIDRNQAWRRTPHRRRSQNAQKTIEYHRYDKNERTCLFNGPDRNRLLCIPKKRRRLCGSCRLSLLLKSRNRSITASVPAFLFLYFIVRVLRFRSRKDFLQQKAGTHLSNPAFRVRAIVFLNMGFFSESADSFYSGSGNCPRNWNEWCVCT